MLKKTTQKESDFSSPFPLYFSQSPMISLQSPIKKKDIASPFPYKKRKKSIYWSTSFIYVEIEKRNFPI